MAMSTSQSRGMMALISMTLTWVEQHSVDSECMSRQVVLKVLVLVLYMLCNQRLASWLTHHDKIPVAVAGYTGAHSFHAESGSMDGSNRNKHKTVPIAMLPLHNLARGRPITKACADKTLMLSCA